MASVQASSANVASIPKPSLTDQEVIEKWKVETYFVHDGTPLLMEDFLNILRLDGSHSWLNDGVVNISLALLTNDNHRSDCLVVCTNDAQILCQIGLGNYEIDNTLDFITKPLKDKTKRWIMVPCNDGMLGSHEGIAKEWKGKGSNKGGRATKKPGEKELPARRPGQGSHWGLLVVDTQENTARWLDGLVNLNTTTKNGKKVTSISQMFLAGTAAGQVLRGYDMLLGRASGQFAVSTLKWIPHQQDDNKTRHDAGACGPHMYACLKHLYEHPQALEDLYQHFRKGSAAPGNFSRGGKGFDSRSTREEILGKIQREAERSTEGEEIGMRLTPRILGILGLRISAQDVFKAVERYRPVRGDKGKDAVSPVQKRGDDILDAAAQEFGEEECEKYRGAWQEAIQAGLLEENITSSLLNFVRYCKQQELMFEDAQQDNEGEQRSSTGTRVEIGNEQYVLPNDGDKEFWGKEDERREEWPEGVTSLPDFAHMSEEDLRRWEMVHPDIGGSKKEHGDKHTDATSRAMLQLRFKKTFLKEPDENFRNVWIHDQTVFDKPEVPKVSDLRYGMMYAYEQVTLSLLDKLKQVKSPGSSDGTKPPPTANAPPRTHHRAIILPDGIDTVPEDFADEKNISNAILAKWKAANDHFFEEMKLRKGRPNVSFRAALQALSGSSFADESDERLRSIWIRDSLVFNKAFREQDPEDLDLVEMRIMLRDAYEGFRKEEVEGGDDEDDEDDGDDDDDDDDGNNEDGFREEDFVQDDASADPAKSEGDGKRRRESDDEEEDERVIKKPKGKGAKATKQKAGVAIPRR